MAERAFCFVKGIGAMKSALRRALSIANALEAFKWAGSPSDDPDGIYFSTQYLRELAIKFRAAAKHLHHPQLRDAFERLSLDVDGHNFGEGVDLHAELLGIVGTLHDFVEEWGDDPSSWPPSSSVISASSNLDEKPLHTKERESLLKLVIGIAIGGYGYDPKAPKSDKPREIAEDLAILGLHLDADTVRKFLRQGRELLPRGENSNQR